MPGPLYSVLVGYKESPIGELRRHCAGAVDQLFSAFLRQHRRCVARVLGGPVNLVLPVPSSSRPGPPPLDRVHRLGIHVVEALAGSTGADPPLWCPGLLERTDEPVGHMAAHAGAFEVAPWAGPLVSRSRVLLLDDTYVSGARAQSTAAALRLAGASRVLIVPLGRVIRPDKIATHAALLARSRSIGAAPPGGHRCARCVVTQAEAEAEAGTEAGSE